MCYRHICGIRQSVSLHTLYLPTVYSSYYYVVHSTSTHNEHKRGANWNCPRDDCGHTVSVLCRNRFQLQLHSGCNYTLSGWLQRRSCRIIAGLSLRGNAGLGNAGLGNAGLGNAGLRSPCWYRRPRATLAPPQHTAPPSSSSLRRPPPSSAPPTLPYPASPSHNLITTSYTTSAAAAPLTSAV